jgi:tetratricopeptide (TPR) repeat protein
MKLYHVLITIAVGLLIAFTSPQVIAAQGVIKGAEVPLNVVATASAKDILIQGNEKFDRKDYKGAIEDYTQVIRLNPSNDDAYFSRGTAHIKLKNYQQAIADFTQVLRIAPNDAEAYFRRGNAHSALKEDQKAIEDYTQVIRLNPKDDVAYFKRGIARALLRDPQKAIEDYTEAIRLNPRYDNAYLGRGNAHFVLKNDQKALEDYDKAIQINPDNVLGYSVRGSSRAVLKDYQGAIEDYTQVIRLDPNDDKAYFSRGDAYFKLKDYRSAREDYTQVIRLNPNSDQAYVSRGLARFILKDDQGAVEDYTEAIRLNPDYADAYFSRGMARSKLKNYQGAIEDYAQALRINPGDKVAREKLEQLEANHKALDGYDGSHRFYITLFVSVLLCLVWIFSISLHEFGHAIVAYWGGDTSVKTKGYLTLNPLKYTHPLVSIILPAIFFVLGGFPLPGAAVYIEQQRLRNRGWQSFVSAAGPIASFLVTLFLIAIFKLSLAVSAPDWLSSTLAFFISMHFFFMLFNLIPIPPLDGYGIVGAWLPNSLQVQIRKFSLFGLGLVCSLFWFPQFNQVMFEMVSALTQWFGVSTTMAGAGFELFNRWYCALPLAAIGAVALIRKPQSLWCFLAEMLSSFQKFDWALAAYDQATKWAPDHALAWSRRGWLLYSEHSLKLSLKQRHETALQSFDRAIQIDPHYYLSWEGRGAILAKFGRFNEALAAFDRAIALEKNDYWAWSERGMVLVTLKRYEEALASFDRAVALRPDIGWLQNQRNLLRSTIATQR